jgi:amidohydrolase
MGAEFELTFSKGYPPTINNDSMAEIVRQCAQKVVGEDNVVEPDLTMGGEDMSFFLEQSKGCFYALGVGRPEFTPVHNPRFDFNEDVLVLGVEIHCRTALELLK